jgi:hypothetical protein
VASYKKRIHHTTYVGQKGTDKGVGLYHDVYSRLMIGIENPKLNQNKMATQSRHSFATAIKKTNSNLAVIAKVTSKITMKNVNFWCDDSRPGLQPS